MGSDQDGRRRGGPVPAMNVTPLVDVVLVLLIIFMVVTPLLAKQVWVDLPKVQDAAPGAPARDENAPLVLSVDAKGVLRIDRDEVARAELAPRLSRLLAARGDGVVYFDSDDEAPYGVAVQAMDAARGAGAKTIAVLTKKAAR